MGCNARKTNNEQTNVMFNKQLPRAGKNMPVDPNCIIYVTQQKLKPAEHKHHKNEFWQI